MIQDLHRLRDANSLLNDLSGFDWKKADEFVERRRIQAFIDLLLTNSVF